MFSPKNKTVYFYPDTKTGNVARLWQVLLIGEEVVRYYIRNECPNLLKSVDKKDADYDEKIWKEVCRDNGDNENCAGDKSLPKFEELDLQKLCCLLKGSKQSKLKIGKNAIQSGLWNDSEQTLKDLLKMITSKLKSLKDGGQEDFQEIISSHRAFEFFENRPKEFLYETWRNGKKFTKSLASIKLTTPSGPDPDLSCFAFVVFLGDLKIIRNKLAHKREKGTLTINEALYKDYWSKITSAIKAMLHAMKEMNFKDQLNDYRENVDLQLSKIEMTSKYDATDEPPSGASGSPLIFQEVSSVELQGNLAQEVLQQGASSDLSSRLQEHVEQYLKYLEPVEILSGLQLHCDLTSFDAHHIRSCILREERVLELLEILRRKNLSKELFKYVLESAGYTDLARSL